MLRSIHVTGVGGQGIVTMANLLTAHLHGLGLRVSLIHATGMAQRGGRVTSELRFSDDPAVRFGPRISCGGADYIIGMEMAETINSAGLMKYGGTLVFNDYILVPSESGRNKERFPDAEEVEERFGPLCSRIAGVRDPVQPVNLFILGVFAAVCCTDDMLSGVITPDNVEGTLKRSLTKRVDENLAAFRRGVASFKPNSQVLPCLGPAHAARPLVACSSG